MASTGISFSLKKKQITIKIGEKVGTAFEDTVSLLST